MTLKEQEEKEEQEQTLWIDQVYRLVSMEWLEYIRREGEKGEEEDKCTVTLVRWFVRRLLSLSTSLRDALVRAGFLSFSLRAAWTKISFGVCLVTGGEGEKDLQRLKEEFVPYGSRRQPKTNDFAHSVGSRLTWNTIAYSRLHSCATWWWRIGLSTHSHAGLGLFKNCRNSSEFWKAWAMQSRGLNNNVRQIRNSLVRLPHLLNISRHFDDV
jgi:hypothetical protein